MEKLYLTWSIFNFIVVLATNINYDRNRRLDGKKIYHTKEKLISGICLIPALYMLSSLMINFYVGIPIIFLLLASVWWFLFDGLYAKLVSNPKQSWWFTGSEDGKDDAKTDNFLQKLTLKQHKIIKFSCIIISSILYIFFKK